jgi:hypothetical protein
MQDRGVMLMDHESVFARIFRPRAARLSRLREIALALIFFKTHKWRDEG